MRYVSPNQRLTGPEAAFGDTTEPTGPIAELVQRARESMSGGRFWAAVLVLLLTLTVARSTAAVRWVDGIDVITFVALGGAVVMGTLALTPIRDALALGVGLAVSPVVAFAGAWQQIHVHHPTDTLGPQFVATWWQRLNDGSAAQDPTFYLVLICLLMWVAGAWLAWCVLRWRKPMLGLIPGAAAFATNILNVPQDQNFFTIAMLVLTLALLLWSNYTGSIANAARASVKLTGDAKWDFWESGLVAMAGLIVIGIMLPPMSTVDRTLDVESGMFASWAQLQQQLNHPNFVTSGKAGGVTGFTDDVKLSGSLQRTRDIVFTYKVVGEYAGPRYFRGVDETITSGGEWRYPNGGGLRQVVAKNTSFVYGEDYQKLAIAGVQVKMQRPPFGNTDVLFYPGQAVKVDRTSMATQVPLNINSDLPAALMYSIDRLGAVQPNSSSGTYDATVEYSTATQAELEAAGTGYPAWLTQYMGLPQNGAYRPTRVQQEELNLAQKIVQSAGATNPYAMASAIEGYLRNSNNFTYSLDARTPPGRDPIEYFLFDSHTGYCEFFATAMGDMLRLLGVPTRLVNGYGPGQFESAVGQYVVRGEDAHTWVEVYFPQYGWVPFEPTADPSNTNYQVITRGANGANICFRDDGCDTPVTSVGGGVIPTPTGGLTRGHLDDPGSAISNGGFHVASLDATALMRIGGVFIGLVLLLLVVSLRYLRPRTVMAVWKRTLMLSGLAGAQRRAGETPLELGRRLRRTFPEAAEPVDALAKGFVVAAYAPREVAETSRASVMEAWSALRPLLLRRVLRRIRPSRP